MKIVQALWALALASMVVPFSAAEPAAVAVSAQPNGWTSAPSGTGRWPAIAEVRSDLPGYTVYRPAKLPAARLPLLIWGNGACRDNGLGHAQFLREIASHGYYVISLGFARAERAVEPGAKMAANAAPPARVDETQVPQMIRAMDWAQRAPADLRGHLDARHIAVAGHSCGGLQAIMASADPRISTSMIFDSGVYNRRTSMSRSNVEATKEDLKKFHAPVAYFLGGPTDIAYANAADDVSRITVPVFFGNLPTGHLGTFWEDANGGEWARAASAWLDWRLKGNQAARAMFAGKDCGLCKRAPWTVDNSKL